MNGTGGFGSRFQFVIFNKGHFFHSAAAGVCHESAILADIYIFNPGRLWEFPETFGLDFVGFGHEIHPDRQSNF